MPRTREIPRDGNASFVMLARRTPHYPHGEEPISGCVAKLFRWQSGGWWLQPSALFQCPVKPDYVASLQTWDHPAHVRAFFALSTLVIARVAEIVNERGRWADNSYHWVQQYGPELKNTCRRAHLRATNDSLRVMKRISGSNKARNICLVLSPSLRTPMTSC